VRGCTRGRMKNCFGVAAIIWRAAFAAAHNCSRRMSTLGENGQALLYWVKTAGNVVLDAFNALQTGAAEGRARRRLDSETSACTRTMCFCNAAKRGGGSPGSRGRIRSYCAKVFKQGRLWERSAEKSAL